MAGYRLKELHTDLSRGAWQQVYAFRKRATLRKNESLAFSSWKACSDHYLFYLKNGIRILLVWQDEKALGHLTFSRKEIDGESYSFLKYDNALPYLKEELLHPLLTAYLYSGTPSEQLVLYTTDVRNDYLETLLSLEISETRELFDLRINQNCLELMANWNTAFNQYENEFHLRFANELSDHLLEEFCSVVAILNDAVIHKSRLFDKAIFSQAEIINRQHALKRSGTLQVILLIFARDSGKLVGYTDVTIHPDVPTLAYQNMTGILEAYRGRGLGKIVKATMLENLITKFPKLERVNTAIHPGNLPSQQLNRKMGFEKVGTYKEYIISRRSIADYLAKQEAT